MRIRIISFLLISLSILLLNCKVDNEKIQIYNPTSEKMVVQLNDSNYTILSHDIIDLEIIAGEYKIQSFIANSKIVDTIIQISPLDTEQGLLLNVSGKKLYSNFENYESSITATTFINELFLVEDSLLGNLDNQEFIDEFVDEQLTKLSIGEHQRYNITPVAIDNYIIVGFLEKYPANQIKVQFN